MNEPNLALTWSSEYVEWARENKKRADRLLKAVQAVLLDHDWDWSVPAQQHITELRSAALDYEDRRG